MVSNVLTGRNGEVVVESTRVSRVTMWSVNPTLDTSSDWGDSDGEGYTLRSAGRRGATADVEGKYATDNEVWDLFQPGDFAILVLWVDSTSLYWDFPSALCNDFNLSVDIDSEEVIGWTSTWANCGIYYYPGQSGATSRTLPA